MSGGITYNGKYVPAEVIGEDIASTVDIPTSDENFLFKLAERKPQELAEEFAYWVDQADKALFANYLGDWWLGTMFIPAVNGKFGEQIKKNMLFHGGRVCTAIKFVVSNYKHEYNAIVFALNLAFGDSTKYSEMIHCTVTTEGISDKLTEFRKKYEGKAAEIAQSKAIGAGKRMLGNYFVKYVTSGGPYGKKILQGKTREAGIRRDAVNRVQIAYNFMAATFGSWLRLSFKDKGQLTTIKLVNTMFSGSDGGFTLNNEDLYLIKRAAANCINLENEDDLDAFYAIFESVEYFIENALGKQG